MQIVIYDDSARDERGLMLENREGTVKISFDELEYVEVLNKVLSFHMADGSVREGTGTLSDVEGKILSGPEFIKCHRSYLINLSFVQEISAGAAVTTAGHRVPVSRQRRGQVRDAWLRFLQQSERDNAYDDSKAEPGRRTRADGPWRILLVDDDLAERTLWANVLREHGCIVHPAGNGREALALAESEHFDCVLLDVMLPGEDGFSICGQLKDMSCAPVIFLSSHTESDRQMEGFSAGGIDYITKDTPAGLFWIKVKTRIDLAVSERTQSLYGPLLLDLTERRVYMDGKDLAFTSAEFDILWLLSERSDHIFTPEEIFDIVWGAQPWDGGQTVLAHMSGLRRKLERAWRAHRFIETVWGEGYRFVPADSSKS